MRLIILSDTHNLHHRIQVPDGDLLIHAGDATGGGSRRELEAFNGWLGTLPHRHKVVIAGNHDFLFEEEPEAARALLTNARYLQDEGCEIEGLRLWGSPWQPRFFDWAFNLSRGAPLAEKWALVPEGIDVLITHGPPFGVLDRTSRGQSAGCEALIEALARIRPRLHVFGHIHEGYGIARLEPTLCVNASICDLHHRPINPPLVLELEPRLIDLDGLKDGVR